MLGFPVDLAFRGGAGDGESNPHYQLGKSLALPSCYLLVL
jgi:hypothetical protein